MGQIVKVAETKTLNVKSQTVGKLKLNVFLSHGTVNTDIVPTDIDLSKLFLKVILKRGGEDYRIFSDAALFWALDSAIDYNLDYVHPLNTTAANMIIVRAKDAAVKEQALMAVDLELPGPINVKASDELTVELAVSSDAFASDIDSAVSYVEVETETVVAYEYAIPSVKVFTVNGGDSTFTPSIGDDCVRLTFVNTDKDSILEADTPLESFSLKADKYQAYMSWRQLVTRRYQNIAIAAQAAAIRQSHVLYHGGELDGVQLNCQLDSSNVTSAKNAVVASYLTGTAQVLNRVMEMEEKHAAENVAKIVNRAKDSTVKERVINRFAGVFEKPLRTGIAGSQTKKLFDKMKRSFK